MRGEGLSALFKGESMKEGLEKFRKDPPYKNTSVPYEKTMTAINKLFTDYGVAGKQWTEYHGEEVLEFAVEVTVKNVKKEIHIRVKPPEIPITKRRRGYGITHERNKNQEYRMMYYWLKSKLEAVAWGLATIEQEFLSQVMMALPDGTQQSVGEVIKGLISEDRLESLPFIDQPKPPKDVERRTVETEYQVKE